MVALFALSLALAASDLPLPQSPTVSRPVALAPPPRSCDPDDVRCRARSALALAGTAKTVPLVMPSPERVAGKAALQSAGKFIKAAKRETPTP